MADIKLNIGGDTRQLENEIKKAVNKNYEINLSTKGSQPLGRITSQVSEFNKSLDASNARVLAFGASAGIIFGVKTAMDELVQSTINVQKSLQDINVILNVSTKEIAAFGDSLFSIAKNTGQSFDQVAVAATEFSRQGLSVAETLKRTSDALILSRLSGLDAAKAVDSLTASINSFASEAVNSTEIVNKFANVDAAFAVSSADLAEAISRVGSSAAQSGVSLNELIALVTSAQQTTARGGSVIGNSFKTIFTRLERQKVIDVLENLGVGTTDASGKLKNTVQLLKDLSDVYEGLGTTQKAAVAEAVGGVFQINILKATLQDLGKENSIYNRALQVSAASTDQAIQRNEELNKTYAAQLNILKENAKQLSASVGERLLGPTFERVVGGANSILGTANEADGNSYGAVLGKGIIDGLAQVIAGPGLALIGGVLIKLLKDFTVYAKGSIKEVLNLNTSAKQQADIQKSINAILGQNPKLLQSMMKGTVSVNEVALQLLNSFKLQTLELQKQSQLSAKIASSLYSKGVRVNEGVPTVKTPKTKADGYIPAFSKESRDVKRGVGGAKSNDKPIGPFNINGEPTIINSGEKLIPNFGGSGETAILTRDMQKSMPMAMGYIPNFAEKTGFDYLKSKTPSELNRIIESKKSTDSEKEAAREVFKSKNLNKELTARQGPIDLGDTERLGLIYGRQATAYEKTAAAWKDEKGQFGPKNQVYTARFNSSGFNPKKAIKPEDEDLTEGLANYIKDYTNRYISFFGNDSEQAKIKNVSELTNLGSLPSIAGTVFETAVTKGTNSVITQKSREGGASAVIDFLKPNTELQSLFNNMPGDYEAKYSKNQAPDIIRKGLKEKYLKIPKVKSDTKVQTKARGYIPNFANPNLIQEVSKRASLVNSNITKKLKEGSGLKDEAYIKAAQKLGVNVTGLEKFMTPMSFPLKGKDKVLNLSKALGNSFGRSFTLDALKMGDWDYVKPQFESAGYTKDDFSKLSKFASTPKGESALKFWKSRASGYIPNFANRRVGYLDGDVLSDPRYEATVAEEIKKLGLKGGLPEYHKYLGDMAKKARKSGSIKKFTGIFGVPGAGKSTMMLGGKNAEKADNAKARKTERIPIITPKDIGRVDEIIDTRASLVGTTKALEGGYWSGLDRLMIMSSSTPEEQKEIKRRRDLRDSQILQGKSNTAFGRSAGTSQGASLDSGYIEAMALSVLGPNKTRVMGINENFKLKRKKGDELPLVEKKQIGLSYGAFSPSTRGHLDMMEMAKKQGISPEDFIVAVSKEGGKIDPKDPHSFRTAIFDQKTRKYLAKKTFTGANVIGANSDLFTGGTIPKMLEVDPVGKRRKFLSAKSGSMAFVGSDKQEKDLQKYKDAGYKVNVGERTEGISGTDARAAILAGDSKLISKIFADHVISTINQIGPNIKNRADVFPEILSRINSKLDKRLDPILAELSTLPSRITKTTPEEVAVKIQGLREQRDKYQKLKQYLPTKFIKKLSGIFPQKYGIPNAAEGYIPNFANALSDSIGRELQESGLPKSQIYVAQKDALVSGANPTGLGVFNKRDEGSVTSENKAIRNKSKGYIPNFANGADASATGTVDKFNSSLQSLTGQVENTTEAVQNEGPSLAANLAAVGTQLGSLAFYLNYNKEDYKKSIVEMAKANRQAARDQLNAGEITKETFDKIKNTKVDGKVPTSMKLKAGLKGAGGPLAFAAPVIAETIANSIPQNSKAGRVGASAASSVGQIGAFAGTGAMIGSAIAPGAGTLVGAGLGAAAGALLSLPDIIGQLSTDMPELSAAALKSSQELNQLNNGASTVLQAYEDYQNALAGDNQELINKTRKNFAASLNGLTEEQKKSVLSAGSLNKASEALAAISNKKAKEFADLKLAQDFGDVGQSFMKQFGVSFKSKEQDTFVKSKFAETSMASGQFKSAGEVRGNKLSTVDSRQKFDETLKNLNIGEPIKKALSGLADTSLIGAISFLNQALEQTAQQFEDTAHVIDAVDKSAETAFNTLKQTLTKEVKQAAAILQKNADNILNFNKTMNSYKLSEMDFSKSQTSSSLSGRQERAVALTGEDSALSLKKTIDVQLNKISSTRESTNQATGKELQENILQNLLKPISDASGGGGEEGGEEGGGGGAINNLLSAIAGSSYGQNPGTKSALDLANAGGGFQNLLNTLNTDLGSKISELLKPSDEKGGLIDDSAIISELQKIASELGLSAQDQAAFSTQVTNAVNAANSSIVATNQTAKQQTQVVAKEATQKVAMQNLQKSLKVFGGADSVINPIDENPFMSAAQEYTQPVNDILQKIGQNVKQGPGSLEATNSGSGGYIYKKGKEEMGEEGGRNILQLIKSMQDMSGGLYKPDANSKEYKLGVDTIEKDINAKIASLKNMASTTESGTAKGVIESMIKSLTSQPGGVRGIAENQMAQLTGTMDEKKFDKNADKSEAAAEKQVAKAAPGLADAQKEAEARDQKTISAFKSIFEGQQQSFNTALSGISGQIEEIIALMITPPPTPPEPEKPEAPKPAEPLPEGFMDKVVNVFRSFFSDPVTAARMAPGGGGLPPLPPPVTTAPATKVDAKPITPSVNDGTYDPALVDKFTTGKNAPATTGSVTGAPITPVKTETIGGDAVSSLGSEIKSLNTNLGTWNQALVDKFSAGQNTNTKDGSKDAGPAAGAGATGGTSQTNNVSVDLAVNVDGVNNINQQLDTQIAEVKKQIAAVMEKLNIKQAPVVGGGGGSTMVA